MVGLSQRAKLLLSLEARVGLKARKWRPHLGHTQCGIVGAREKALFTMESLFPMEVNLRFSCCKDAGEQICF